MAASGRQMALAEMAGRCRLPEIDQELGIQKRSQNALRASNGEDFAHLVALIAVTASVFIRSLIPKNVAGFALQIVTDRGQRPEPDALDPPRLKQGKIGFGDTDRLGKFLRPDLPTCQHDIEIDDYRHQTKVARSRSACTPASSAHATA